MAIVIFLIIMAFLFFQWKQAKRDRRRMRQVEAQRRGWFG